MFRTIALAALLAPSTVVLSQRVSYPHPLTGSDLPEWVRAMYAPDADPEAVQAAYDAYYATHPFVKNNHTQYFKRWKRELGHDLEPKDPQQRAA